MPHWGVDPNGEIFGLVGLAAILVKGALIGAGVGAVSYSAQTAIMGQPWNLGQFGKSIGMGAVGGAVAGGVGHVIGGVGSFGNELGRAVAHGITQQGVGVAFGIDPSLGGFAAGAAGSLMSSGLQVAGAGTGEMIGASAIFGGAVSELSGGNFLEGFATAGIVASANHGLHKTIEGFENRSLIKQIQRDGWKPIDMSDPSKSYKNTIQGIKVMDAYTKGKLHDVFGDVLQMDEIFNFSTMTAKSGWDVHDGQLFKLYKNSLKPGVKISLQNGLGRVNDIDLTIRNRINIYTGLSNRLTSTVVYHNSNYADWLAARNFIWNH